MAVSHPVPTATALEFQGAAPPGAWFGGIAPTRGAWVGASVTGCPRLILFRFVSLVGLMTVEFGSPGVKNDLTDNRNILRFVLCSPFCTEVQNGERAGMQDRIFFLSFRIDYVLQYKKANAFCLK